MSFLKSLKGLADNLMDKDKQKQDSSYTGGPHQQQQPQHSSFLQQSNPHGGAPPHNGYGAPPSGPQLPHGWIQQWDQNTQRYYYLEQATGRTQWDPPAGNLPGMDYQRGLGAPSGQQYGYNQNFAQQQGHGYLPQKSNNNGMLAAGAGGLLVGGLAGSALSGNSGYDQPYAQGAPGGYGGAPMGDAQALEHNSDVSSSQRSSLEEAREDYEEAQRKAADSDASSSDREDAREAREEYQEEIEEAREDAYDD